MEYNYSYNVLIERFKAFADGHYLIKRFTHGQIDLADMDNDEQYPFMHVTPDVIKPANGSITFGFHVMFADIPRDKETKAEYQREVISDCVRLAQDLIGEIKNGLTLFGYDVQMANEPTLEPFMEEYKNTLTGIAFTIELEVPYNWSACDIPANWTVGGSSSGGSGAQLGVVFKVNGINNAIQNVLDLVEGAGITIVDNGDGSVTFTSTASGSAWGGITGTLSNQVDLQNALDDKADITSLGATAFSNDYNDLDNLPTIPSVLDDLSDVDTSGQALQKVLYYDGTKWIAYELSKVAYTGSYNDLSNKPAIPKTVADLIGNGDKPGDLISWNGSAWAVIAMLNLDDLGNVNVPSPTNGQVLTYDAIADEWQAVTPVTGSVNSVGLTMPAAFSVTGSPVTTSGTLAVTGAGSSTQYVDGTGALQTMPTGLPPSGAAGGDLSGTYPNPNVSRIHGIDMQSGTPTAGDVWLYEGSPAKWQHQKLPAIHVTNDSAVTGSTVKDALNHLDSTKQATLVSGSNIKTVNSQSLVGSGDVAVGTVTSVSGTGTTAGLSLSGTVTSSGNITLGGTLSTPVSTINDSTTVGQNLVKLPNPSAVRYLRINADNTISALTLAQLKSDLSVSSAIMANAYTNTGTGFESLTELSFAVTANKTYKWRATLTYTSTAAITFALTGPATPTFNNYRFTVSNAATTNTVFNAAAYDTGTNAAASSNGLCTADGIIRVTASGTVTVRIRCATIGAMIVRAGSIIEFEEVL